MRKSRRGITGMRFEKKKKMTDVMIPQGLRYVLKWALFFFPHLWVLFQGGLGKYWQVSAWDAAIDPGSGVSSFDLCAQVWEEGNKKEKKSQNRSCHAGGPSLCCPFHAGLTCNTGHPVTEADEWLESGFFFSWKLASPESGRNEKLVKDDLTRFKFDSEPLTAS